eukprot:CAMPEP_0113556518 /NCGR_PEP_ID=MMETSP0015_2-20120614/17297_1 /TAXON_ID=2838 /ORGANISM="Odontella" /LENGTH=55 /DNA_ID=CAMNT_0000457875 /DNA_START=245 /DNA_END=408 /DNA_ORIENTATION=- /assembly_acc=CAM_ASM_000160
MPDSGYASAAFPPSIALFLAVAALGTLTVRDRDEEEILRQRRCGDDSAAPSSSSS